MPHVVVDGKLLEADPPRKLVRTFRMLCPLAAGVSRLTTTARAPRR